jgi:hypothetical protein
MKAKKPKQTAEEKALAAAQARELDRTQEEINERKRRTLRSEMGGRSSLLSGSERGVREGEVRQMTGTPSSTAGRSGRPRRAGIGAGVLGGLGIRSGGGRR